MDIFVVTFSVIYKLFTAYPENRPQTNNISKINVLCFQQNQIDTQYFNVSNRKDDIFHELPYAVSKLWLKAFRISFSNPITCVSFCYIHCRQISFLVLIASVENISHISYLLPFDLNSLNVIIF